jgi:peptidoglycan/LPS O-acetylase OafA/YrhL
MGGIDHYLASVPFLPISIVMIAALLTCFCINTAFGPPEASGRQNELDGLRGFLALFVFIHHFRLWKVYSSSGEFLLTGQQLFAHLGPDSVCLFFMITSYLFFSKLLNARGRPIDWFALFISRLLRIAPLYLFSVALFFYTVGVFTDWELRVPRLTLLKSMGRWLALAIVGAPDLNGFSDTYHIMGVTWTLRYEWFSYFSLPLLALATGVRAPKPFLALASLSLAFLYSTNLQLVFCLSFLGGIVAAILARSAKWRSLAAQRVCSIAVIALIAINVTFINPQIEMSTIALNSAVFIIVTGGNNLCGLLTSESSRTLGEISYSVYLLHNLLLFWLYRSLLGEESLRNMSETHWLCVVLATTPVLIVACYATYRLIEVPPIEVQRMVGAVASSPHRKSSHIIPQNHTG